MVSDSFPAAKRKTRVLLITPPLLQPNAPYPATAVLAGFLQAHGFRAPQADLSLALLLRLFSADGVNRAARIVRRCCARTPATRHFLRQAARFASTVEPVVAFLQGRNAATAARILAGNWLPEGPRFQRSEVGDQRSGDSARHKASLFLDDLADAIRDGVDPRFGFARYAEHLAVTAPRFDPLRRALAAPSTLVDRMLYELTDAALAKHDPGLVALTVPFPGTLYGALRIARRIRRTCPQVRIALGGGYVNTELRELDDPRLFDFIDYLCFDDGEEPLLALARTLSGEPVPLVRTFVRRRGIVVRSPEPGARNPESGIRIPAFSGLPLDRYLSLAESTNPMHRLWSDRCWLKLPLAHGCYWHKCRFCDIALDYIGRYVPPRADDVVQAMTTLRRRTGLNGFHFTDEALSPALLRQISARLLARRTRCEWWGNVRLERAFTPELAGQMSHAGCVAVTGGLECAHDRLLALMQKGITLRDAARACKAFADARILVHAYLMYGFPTQTLQETIDGLEYVRQLFAAGLVQSAYWHCFALTCHSPIAVTPADFGIRIRAPRVTPGRTFARNELAYDILPGRDRISARQLVRIGEGLRRATYNYLHGAGLDEPANAWFRFDAPDPTLPEDFVARA